MFIDFSEIDFKCPYCEKKYSDDKDVYLNRCNKNKNGYTRIKCTCQNNFYMTYDMMGKAVSFK